MHFIERTILLRLTSCCLRTFQSWNLVFQAGMASVLEGGQYVQFTTGSLPWPDTIDLFQPYQGSQILLPDAACCLGVKAFLHMCGIKFKVELRTNAEHMSPSGKVPFIQAGPFVISELEPIIAFVNTRGFHLSEHLSDSEKAEMKAYMALVENILVNAELYLSWCDSTVANEVSKPRYGSHYPWPLNWLLPARKQYEVRSKLRAIGWDKKSFSEVCGDVKKCCEALSERLGKSQFFFGDRPTELDALVYGHLYVLLTTQLPVTEFATIAHSYRNLEDFCMRIDQRYFRERELK